MSRAREIGGLCGFFMAVTGLSQEAIQKRLHARSQITVVAKLQEVFVGLSDRECKSLEARFGYLGDSVPKRYTEVSKAIGVSEQRGRLVVHKALRKLRRPDRFQRLCAVLDIKKAECAGFRQ